MKLKQIFKVLFFTVLCLIPLSVLLPLVLPLENDMQVLIKQFNKQDITILPAIDSTYDSILSGNYEAIINQISELDPETSGIFKEKFAHVAEYISLFKVIKQDITALSYNFSPLADSEIYQVKIQKEIVLTRQDYGVKYFILDLELTKLTNNTWILTKFAADTADSSIKEINHVSWTKMSYTEKLLIIASIFIPFFILIAEYLCLFKTNFKFKWLWTIFIMFGFTELIHNFSLHNTIFDPVSLALYGAGFWKPGLYGELIVHISIPVGAILFMTIYIIKHHRNLKILNY